MGRRDTEERAEDASEREAADGLVQLEAKLRAGETVYVDEVRRAWKLTRYPQAMIRVLTQRKRPELAQRAAAIVGIEVDPTSPSWREDLDAMLFEHFFGKRFDETDALADAIRRAIPDPSS
jgi:hypothetical protein